MTDWRTEISKVEGLKSRYDVALSSMTTLRVGGPVECLVEPDTEVQLEKVVKTIRTNRLPFYLLGRGSNLIAPDEGLPGIGIKLGKGFQGVEKQGELIFSLAGTPNGSLVEQCRKWGLGGLEFLIAVPGTIGGAIAMNAGAHNAETAEFVQRVRYLSQEGRYEEEEVTPSSFAYRHSPFRAPDKIVVGGWFRPKSSTPEDVKQTIANYQSYRRDTQPREFPNCGSVFRNPNGDHAGRLIEEAGLKGTQRGGAQISEKHANFIVNRGDAKAADVFELIDLIKETVYKNSGVELALELQVLQFGNIESW